MAANGTGDVSRKKGPARSTEKRSHGLQFERLAEAHCLKLGYRILNRNLWLGQYEVDLLAEDAIGSLVVVEVRGRHSLAFRPSCYLTPRKIRRLKYLALSVAQHSRRPVRIELFEVLMPPGEAARVNVFRV